MTPAATPTLLDLTDLNHTCLIQVPEKLITHEAIQLRDGIRQLIDNNPNLERVILDFSCTTFVDSGGIGALVSTLKFARSQGIDLEAWSVQPSVMLVLSICDLDSYIRVTPNTQGLAPQMETQNVPVVTHPSVKSPLKRALDIAGAIVGLSLTAVVIVPIAIAITLDNPGPILFKQTRCGWMGRRFTIWKFRSMVANAEALKSQVENQAAGAIFKNENDPRVTKVGRFLRKTSLDELPQFWNVLMGDMSLVGTRPPTPDEVDHYAVPNWNRLNVKPGLTGEWQVNGRSQIKDFDQIIELDLRYQRRWSMKYDVQLILKTITMLFSKNQGAY